ncbi:MAG: hypothetical protein AABZ39_20410 [Spirochaetota bacterium]
MRKIILMSLVAMTAASLFAGSFYLNENFGPADGSLPISNIISGAAPSYAPNGSNGWTNALWYGREGAIIPALELLFTNTNRYMSQQIFSNGKLEISGSVSPGDAGSSRDGRWKGKWIWHTNSYHASEYAPFGWEVIREAAFLDISDVDTKPGSGGAATDHVPTTKSDARKHAAVGLAMFYDDPLNRMPKTYNFDRTYEGSSFANYFEWSEHAGFLSSWFRRFEIYDSGEISLENSFLTAARPSGVTTNISNAMYWDYIITNDWSWTPLTNMMYWNTNAIGFRIIHDGEALNMYVNPNPYGQRPAYPNEWLFVKRRAVTWNSNFSIMIGNQQRGFGGYLGHEWAFGTFDNLLIRSACDASAFIFSPAAISNAINFQTVSVVITNVILPANNAGVNYLRIIKPVSFDYTNDLVAGITVKTHFSNSATECVLSNYIYSNGSFPADAQCAIMTNSWTNAAGSNEICILLGNQVTNFTQVDWQYVKIDIVTRSTNPFFYNDAWTAYVMAEKFDAMPAAMKSNYSTCGWQKCIGTGLLGVTTSPALGFASITPTSVQQVVESYSMTLRLSTYDITRDPIRQIAILVPWEFQLCAFSNFNSAYLGFGVSNYLAYPAYRPGLSNVASSNLITISYPANNYLPAQGARETISFDVIGRPRANINTNDVNLVWQCWVDGSAVTSNSLVALTNADNPSQTIVIFPDTNATTWDLSIDDVRNRSSGQAVKNAESEVLLMKVHRPGYTNAQMITNIIMTNLLTNHQYYGFFNLYTNCLDDSLVGSVLVSQSNFISNLNGYISITNIITNLSASVISPTRLIFTYTPLTFDTFATNKFRVHWMKVAGTNATTNQYNMLNTNLLAIATSNIKLEDNTLTADVLPLLTNNIKQGSRAAAMRINLKSLDQDAVFNVNSLTFTITATNMTNHSEISLAVYRDNGSVVGVYDTADSIVPGSDGVFVAGSKFASFASTVTIDKNDTYLYAVITMNADAQVGGKFTLNFPKSIQAGFIPAGASITNDGFTESTVECSISPAVTFAANDAAAVGRTYIRPSLGERAIIYLDDATVRDFTQYKAYIYDITGAKVQEIAFTSYVAYWDARSIAGQVVRTGMYIAIIKGPNNYTKKVKLMVVK